MLDQAKSSAIARSPLPVGTLAPIPQSSGSDPRPLPDAPPRSIKTDAPLYSIRFVEKPGAVCAACVEQITGAGPVGYLDDEPICDLCTLHSHRELGMVLALVAVARTYASIPPAESMEERSAALLK